MATASLSDQPDETVGPQGSADRRKSRSAERTSPQTSAPPPARSDATETHDASDRDASAASWTIYVCTGKSCPGWFDHSLEANACGVCGNQLVAVEVVAARAGDRREPSEAAEVARADLALLVAELYEATKNPTFPADTDGAGSFFDNATIRRWVVVANAAVEALSVPAQEGLPKSDCFNCGGDGWVISNVDGYSRIDCDCCEVVPVLHPNDALHAEAAEHLSKVVARAVDEGQGDEK